MAHLIDMTNRRANMAYVGVTPWHGLGEQLTEGAPIDVWAREAGMAHTIESSRVAFRWGEDKGEVGVMDDRRVLWRSDTKAPLAVVSNRYQVVQPGEVLEFFRDLVDATGDYALETAGCLDDGKKYWALARYRDALEFGGDIVKPYLLLATACDGSMATTARHTSVRVVCNNTLQMSLHGEESAIRVAHSTKFDADSVKARLGVGAAHARFAEDIDSLITKAITRERAAEIFVDLVATRDKQTGEITNEKNVKRIVGEIMASMDRGPGANLSSARGTAWGAINAVTHYVDFKARARSDNNRFSSGQFGIGANLKAKAFNALIAA